MMINMAEIIGVRFKNVGKIYYFDPDGAALKKGDFVEQSVLKRIIQAIEAGEE